MEGGDLVCVKGGGGGDFMIVCLGGESCAEMSAQLLRTMPSKAKDTEKPLFELNGRPRSNACLTRHFHVTSTTLTPRRTSSAKQNEMSSVLQRTHRQTTWHGRPRIE